MRHLLLLVLFLMGVASISDRTGHHNILTTEIASELGEPETTEEIVDAINDEVEEITEDSAFSEPQLKTVYKTEANDLCDLNIYVQSGRRDFEKRATCLLVEKIGGYYTSAPMENCHSDFVESGRDLFYQATCTRNKFATNSTIPAIQNAEAAITELTQEQCGGVADMRSQLINTMFSQDIGSAEYSRAQHVLMGLNEKEIATCSGGNYWQTQTQEAAPAPYPNNGFIPQGTVPAVK